jgi:RNA polymerase sigma-70 factor (ECF subfamily)
MILRNTMTTLFGIGSLLLVADSCAASPFPGSRPLRDQAGGYELTVLVDGAPARTYMHGGETYVLGQLGSHYTLRVSNHTGRRIEAVVSVDGRDAIDGRPADWRSKRGYLVPAWGSVDIEGWRISHAQAAAFRFSSVPDSYAARTGNARDVGVIGVAVFPERYLPPRVYRVPPPRPYPYPYRDSYPYDDYYRGEGEGGRSAPSARSDKSAPSSPSGAAPAPSAPPPADAAGEGSSGAYGKGSRSEARPFAERNRPAWAPSTARPSTRASTRSSSCAPTRAAPAPFSVPVTTIGTVCWRWGSRSTAITTRPATTTTTATCVARLTRSLWPTGGLPRPRPDGSALAIGGKPGEDHRWVANDEADEVLLQAYRAGDVRAFERLVARYEKPIWNFLRRFVADAATAEDLLQEVFLRVVKSADEWRGAAKFSTWLYTIARNLTVDQSRRAVHRNAASLDGPAHAGSDSTATLHDRLPSPDRRADDLASDRETKRRIDEAVAALPAEQREVFLMREVMEMPFAEIATAVGASEPTVKSRMRYALEKLRAALVELGGEPPSAAESSGSG